MEIDETTHLEFFQANESKDEGVVDLKATPFREVFPPAAKSIPSDKVVCIVTPSFFIF